jgi:uncharacterized protein (DUF488 family)
MNKIYTIGYTSTTPEELIELVSSLESILVDIRISPYSKDYRWRQKSLQQYFNDKYLHIKEFGNANYKIGSIKISNPHLGIIKITPTIKNQSVILLCACYDYEKCHRKQVSSLLAEAFHLEVEHLYGKSKSKSSSNDPAKQLSLF